MKGNKNMKDKSKIKKKLYFIFVVSAIILALAIPFVFAIQTNTEGNETKFFEVDSLSKTVGSNLEMKINLDYIKYHNFKFTLSSNSSIMNTTEINLQDNQESTSKNVEVEKEDSAIVIQGNKQELNISQMILNYTIPNSAKVGDTIILNATIEEVETQTEDDITIQTTNEIQNEIVENNEIESNVNEKIENDIVNKENNQVVDENNKVNNNVNTKETIQITINIVEDTQKDNEKQEENTVNNDKNKQNINTNEQNKTTSTKNNITMSNSVVLSSQTVVYNGSSNNYLSKLKIDGYNLNCDFSKTNCTYFVEIEDEIDKVDVTAKAEESSAKVCIYGNDNLEEGTNKILIYVTAENGDVRTYRIYVTK